MPVAPVFYIIHCPVCGNQTNIHSMVGNTPLFFRIIGINENAHIKCEKCNSLLIYNHKKGTIKFKK